MDRFLINNALEDHFPWLIQNCLPRLGSDHVPLSLEVGTHGSSIHQFKFELVWFTVESFQELVHKWWIEIAQLGYGAFIFSKRVAHSREQLRNWAKYYFGSIKLRKLSLLHYLEVLNIASESRCLTHPKVSQ